MRDTATVLFDADGVLQHARHGWVGALDAIGGEGFASVVFARDLPAMRGEARMRDCLVAAAEEHGVALDPDDALQLWSRFDIDEEAMAVVAKVRRAGYGVRLATNQQDVRRDLMRRRYAGVFDEEFYSCELGACKPAEAFFASIIDRLDVPAGQIVFVDDSARNVAAATSCGIRAHLHDPSSGAAGMRRMLEGAGVRM